MNDERIALLCKELFQLAQEELKEPASMVEKIAYNKLLQSCSAVYGLVGFSTLKTDIRSKQNGYKK